MGGKRPDQYQISPGEAGGTDYKWRRLAEDGLGGHVPDKKERKRSAQGRGLIPPNVPNPEVERLRAEEMERQDHMHADSARSDEDFVVDVELESDSDMAASDENV